MKYFYLEAKFESDRFPADCHRQRLPMILISTWPLQFAENLVENRDQEIGV